MSDEKKLEPTKLDPRRRRSRRSEMLEEIKARLASAESTPSALVTDGHWLVSEVERLHEALDIEAGWKDVIQGDVDRLSAELRRLGNPGGVKLKPCAHSLVTVQSKGVLLEPPVCSSCGTPRP